MLLDSGNSIEITTKEPWNVKTSDTSKVTPKFLVIREKLGVVDDYENPVCFSRGDWKVTPGSRNQCNFPYLMVPKGNDSTRETRCRDCYPIPIFPKICTKTENPVSICFCFK